MTKVVIVGAGMMGTATAYPLADNGHSVHLVGTHLDREIITSCKKHKFHPKLNRKLPEGVRPYYVEEIAEALENADIILSGVNSLGVHWIGKTLRNYVKPGQLIIAITKGLENNQNGDLTILPDILASELPDGIRQEIKYAAVGGPCIAGELAGHRQSCVVFGSREKSTADELAQIFRTSYYHIWTTQDLIGLEYCSALKNAYAMGIALAYGILKKSGGIDGANANMHNLAAALFAQACNEINVFLKIAGATEAFTYGLPGAGDLFVTIQGGRTARLGQLLGSGYSYEEAHQALAGETLEAVEIIHSIKKAIPKLEKLGQLKNNDLPLMRALIDLIVNGSEVTLPINNFFGGTSTV